MRAEFAAIIGIQGAIVITGAALIYEAVGLPAVKSFIYGSLVAMIVAILLAWRYKQGVKLTEVGWMLRQAYKTAIERFILTIFLMVIGFKILEFPPLWLLVGFVVGQITWLLAPIWMKTENTK